MDTETGGRRSVCSALLHLEETPLAPLPEALARQYQFHDLRLELLVLGYCNACWQVIQAYQQEGSSLAHD